MADYSGIKKPEEYGDGKGTIVNRALTPDEVHGNFLWVLQQIATTEAQVALKANLASPTFTGTPKVPSKTAAAGSDGTLIATEAQVNLKANLASPAITGAPTVGGHKIAVVANNTGVNDTNLPIGSYVLVLSSASTTISRNTSSTIYLTTGADFSFVNSSLPSNQGTALDGKWRSCGIGVNSGSYRDSLFRRIS